MIETRRSLTAFILLVAALIAALSPAAANACSGRVVGVTDGDTVKVLCDGIETKVRLDQIDAPERAQAFGSRSKEALSNLVYDKTVRLQVSGTDRYKRTLATIWIGDTDTNREMVRQGYAWAYRQYLRDDDLIEVEDAAKAARRGLWSDPHAIPPWEFRKLKRK